MFAKSKGKSILKSFDTMKKTAFLLLGILISSLYSIGQNVSVSPSRLYFDVEVGEYGTKEIMVTNNSGSTESFQITFADFEANGNQGKIKMMEAGESEHSCSQWLSANPAFFEIGPGESKNVKVILQLPNTPDANSVKWATMIVKLAKEKKAPGNDENDKTVGLGILQTFQFVIHIFQTPPSVTFKKLDIIDFKDISTLSDKNKRISLEVENSGDAILNCASYLELTNYGDGETKRLDIKAFTILPGTRRQVVFDLPADLKRGKYSLLGVVDYGSDETIEAAEMDLDVE